MQGLLYASARHRDRELHISDEDSLIAVAVSGTLREIALVVALIETAGIEPVDLWLDPICRPLKSVLERRTGIRRVLFSPTRTDPDGRSLISQGQLPVYGRYREVIPIGICQTEV